MENKGSDDEFCLICSNADKIPDANLSTFGCDVKSLGICGNISIFDSFLIIILLILQCLIQFRNDTDALVKEFLRKVFSLICKTCICYLGFLHKYN